MSEKNVSSGETITNYLEKIKPKDLIMFSPKTREIIAKVFVISFFLIFFSLSKIDYSFQFVAF